MTLKDEENITLMDVAGPIRKTKLRVKERIGLQMLLTFTGYNLIRMRTLTRSLVWQPRAERKPREHPRRKGPAVLGL